MGTLTADGTGNGTHTYQRDAENRMTPIDAGSTASYTYNALGQRVKKDSGRLYWNSIEGQLLAETDLNGSLITEYIYFLGQVVARREAGGTVYYFYRDHLGSLRTITDATGAITRDSDYYPFGTERWVSGTGYDSHMFAGMERDSETGEYHTLFRQQAPNLGRWLSPDPVHGQPQNPQGLNRYAYVGNMPTNRIDPRGDQFTRSSTSSCRPNDPAGCCYDPCTNFTYRWMHRDECGGGGGGTIPGIGNWTYCYCDKILGRTRSGLLGCVYVCSCDDGTTVTLGRRCNKVDPYANLKCPAAIEAKCPRTVLLGTCTVVSPSPFCGPETTVPPTP